MQKKTDPERKASLNTHTCIRNICMFMELKFKNDEFFPSTQHCIVLCFLLDNVHEPPVKYQGARNLISAIRLLRFFLFVMYIDICYLALIDLFLIRYNLCYSRIWFPSCTRS